ncbi:hypothetical protein BCR34DRAFT_70232 [Clohesyomyces aquaticus]|uniref:Zn(2)-C6 fungal-type domain-containing protein n=1 Tax=Clohesyomyces aquaticus TaxID=1231657 RepID=A0A1Y1YZM9_9PLEO|nr:hypothetical protein BCR34DRAFT_70232 [Clohesyomyces aquaticus]
MSGSRRIACEKCRDRKVRCGGELPACDRCCRAGENCVYSQTQNPTKADLLQTIETLKERLADLQQNQQEDKPEPSPHHPSSSLSSAASVDYSECSPFNIATPGLVGHDDAFLQSHCNPYHSMAQFPENMDFQFLDYLPSPHNTPQFQLESMISPDGMNQFSLAQIPSLREVRELNKLPAPSVTSSPSSLALSGSRTDEQLQIESYRKIIRELSTYCATSFATQTEIAGITSVVAEYLSWVRKRPSKSAATALEANWTAILETLELRVREVHNTAETRHRAAWEQMITALKMDGLETHFSTFENEVQQRSEQTRQFFQEHYDVTVPFLEQILRQHEKKD